MGAQIALVRIEWSPLARVFLRCAFKEIIPWFACWAEDLRWETGDYHPASVFTTNSARSRSFRIEICTASATAGSSFWAFAVTCEPAS